MKTKVFGIVGVLMVTVFFCVADSFAASDPAAVVDTLTVTVDEICTLTRTEGTGTYTTSLQPNKTNMKLGTSEFTAVCNSPSGYQVVAAFTALTGSKSGSIPYVKAKPTTSTARWTAVLGENSSTTYLATSGAKLMDTDGPDTSEGTVQKVSYKVSTGGGLADGTYTGTATYTLTEK
ncbi:hypothetical protein IJ162_01580 [Candidatus Saccharibacteria bacterium]|nr:hypothetical protein [Candidatus Saccharibacteria bacterium]